MEEYPEVQDYLDDWENIEQKRKPLIDKVNTPRMLVGLDGFERQQLLLEIIDNPYPIPSYMDHRTCLKPINEKIVKPVFKPWWIDAMFSSENEYSNIYWSTNFDVFITIDPCTGNDRSSTTIVSMFYPPRKESHKGYKTYAVACVFIF